MIIITIFFPSNTTHIHFITMVNISVKVTDFLSSHTTLLIPTSTCPSIFINKYYLTIILLPTTFYSYYLTIALLLLLIVLLITITA